MHFTFHSARPPVRTEEGCSLPLSRLSNFSRLAGVTIKYRTTKNVSYSVRPSPPSGILTTATLGTLGRRAACSAAALALERGLELGGDLVATRIGSKSEAAPGHAPA